MSDSVSPIPYTGNKNCIQDTILSVMPPHKTYLEACMGSAEIFLRKARAEKDWETADRIRDELKARHVVLEDTPQGIKWRIEE